MAQQDITFNGFHLPTLARLARELNSPTDDALAEFIWRLSNMDSLPAPIAHAFMHAAGYLAFQGFPLTKRRFQ